MNTPSAHGQKTQLCINNRGIACLNKYYRLTIKAYTEIIIHNMSYTVSPTSLLSGHSLPIWQRIHQVGIATDQGGLAPGNFRKVDFKNRDTSKGSFRIQPEIQRVEPCPKWQNLTLRERDDQVIQTSTYIYQTLKTVILPASSSRIL